ncbi:Uncharacterised protein [Moraxella lacunata]|uniref:Transcription regulator HTH AraC N-terminal domain-containing protein n=1 Tax=Moraxella lacunata TaxID=477 RepID=A0A378T5T7_MORLA|nr:AraC family transcriptional regulator [Moraxella lacunata]STZ56181.1 Uncharacterised protein [Moraxella lacunata]
MLDANAYFPRSLIDNLLTIITPNERRVTHIDNLYLFHSDRPYVEYDGSIKGCGISIVLQGQTQMYIGNAYHQRNVGQVIAFSADLPVRALICNVSASLVHQGVQSWLFVQHPSPKHEWHWRYSVHLMVG